MFRRCSLFVCAALLTLAVSSQTGSTARRLVGPSESDKPTAPMEVELSFLTTPSPNTLTTLSFKVTSLQDAPNTTIKVVLPQEAFTILSGKTEWHDDLLRGETRTYEVQVMPLTFGKFTISASAICMRDNYSFGRSTDLFLDLGAEGSKVSKTKVDAEQSTTESQTEQISQSSTRPATDVNDYKVSPSEQPVALAPGAGQIVIKGYWYYRDKNGVDQPLRDARVEIWDLDTFSGDDLLATIRTNNSGYYESAVISNSGDEAGGQDVYVKVFSTDDISVRVTDFSSNLYSAQAATKSNVPDGYVDFGGWAITDANNRMAYYIYDKIANDAYDYLVNNVGWANLYNLQVRWSPTSSTGTYYVPGGSVDLVAGDRWDSDVFLHEYGHFVMYKIYGNSYPSTPNCNPHSWGTHSSLGCAWSEGWANFLQAAIQNDRYYDDTEDQTLHIDYEPPSPFADHAEDEGAVAASLWDVFDSGSEVWDSLNYGINGYASNGTWATVSGTRPNDVIGFYNNWMSSANGFDSQVTSILQHHNVIPNPVLTASLTFSPAQPYVVGQTVTGKFSITNRGNRSITFDVLTIGGRLNGDSNVVDFPWLTNLTLTPNQTYQYVGNFNFNQTGNYRFFPAYKLRGEVWRIGLLDEIPADTGIAFNANFNVTTSCLAPGVFSLGVPSNGQNFASSTSLVTLAWSESPNANSYDVYFGTNSNPGFLTNVTGTAHLDVNVTQGQTYWWKVIAKASCNSSLTSSSAVWSFTVQQQTCNAPGAFSLSGPNNGQSFSSSTTSATLSWGQSANANSYDVYFGTSSSPGLWTNTTGTSVNVSVTQGQTYFWKVVAKVNCSSSTTTAGTWSFSVQSASTCNAPGAFSLSGPSNGQSFFPATTSATLSWGQSANANSYDVYFGTSSNPGLWTNTTGTSVNVSVTQGQTYFWKVVAKVNCSSSTTTAGVWSFSVQSSQTCNSPGAFSLTGPSNGQTFSSSTTSATLLWGQSANADFYDVYFGTNSNPSFWSSVNGASLNVSVSQGQTYYWKVVARVNCNSSLSSTTGTFSFSVQSPLTDQSQWSYLDGRFDRMAVGKNADGRLEVFVRGTDGALWHRAQTTAGSASWGPWSSLGGWFDRIAVARNADGRLQVFVRGSDGALNYIAQSAANSAAWTNWSWLGGWIDNLAVETNSDGRVEVFVSGSDNSLWHRAQASAGSSSWDQWSPLGGWIDRLAVTRNADGRLDVFVRGSNGGLWHRAQTTAGSASWGSWSSLGGWFDRLAVGRNQDGRLEVFVRGNDGALDFRTQAVANSDSWNNWSWLGGWIDNLAVGNSSDGRLQVFVSGSDGALYCRSQFSPSADVWNDWLWMGGWIDQLAVGASSTGYTEVFARGSNQGLWHILLVDAPRRP